MIKIVKQMRVSDVFATNSDKIYRIPKYQREYTWGKAEWEALFCDVMENNYGYFLGSYICVSSSSLGNTVLEVIDGQQRFTSLTLLMAALYEKLNAIKDSMEEDERTDVNNLRNELAYRKTSYTSEGKKITEYTQRLFLQKQNKNDEDYGFVFASAGIITADAECPSNFGNRRIAKGYKYFSKLIDDKIIELKVENPQLSDGDALFNILNHFNAAILVGIEVDSNKDAYMLFESLNHRGVPLSALDLIKNTLIAQTDNEISADKCYIKWKTILKYIGQEEYSVQERFFRQYYNAFRDELNLPFESVDRKYYLGYLATKTTLLDIYEKMIKHDYSKLLDDLSIKASRYSVIINNSEENYVYSDALLELERISGAPSYMLLLYILSNQKELVISDNQIHEIVNLLIKFFVRRSITDIPSTRRLAQLFIDIIAQIKHLEGQNIVVSIHDKLCEVSASEEIFEEKLRGALYDENPEATRFILCSIEAKHQTKEIYSDLWSRDKNNKYVWTIEHIFPEGQNITESWVKMIADGDALLAKKYRNLYVHTLGNLTITGYNQNLSNMPFEQKRDRKSKDKSKDIGYRNGLYLNQDVVNESSWTVEKIIKRTNKIVNLLKEMYKW